MVDRSLETLAADRGITICFADLDGIDGLWLPGERTILVSKRLGDRRAAEVLDHELTHVDIEDGHAALDAAVRRRAGRTRIAAGSAAAACLVLLLAIRVPFSGHSTGDVHQLPPPQAGLTTAPPETGRERPAGAATGTTKVVTQVYDGRIHTRTVTVTPATSGPAAASTARPTTKPVAPTVPAGPVTTTTPPASPPASTSSPPPSPTDTPTPSASPTQPAGTTVELPAAK